MGQKAIQIIKLTETLTLCEYKNGFWLWDATQQMNLSMKAKTERDAFVEALSYYQRRCTEVSEKKKSLLNSVNNFITSLSENEEIYFPCDCDEY
jgi:hypothetical protein